MRRYLALIAVLGMALGFAGAAVAADTEVKLVIDPTSAEA